MPIARALTLWPTRINWPRRQPRSLPALPQPSAPDTLGQSRFTISPLRLTLDQLLLLVACALLSFGLIMVQSADTRIRNVNENWWLPMVASKNILHAGLSIFVIVVVWRLDYRRLLGKNLLLSPSTWLLAITFLCLVAVLVTPLGKNINGARRWIWLGPLSFQPSELAKLGLVLFLSAYAIHRADDLRRFLRGFAPAIIVFGLVAGLVVKEDFGTTALIGTVCFVLLVMSGYRWWHTGMLLLPAAVGVWAMLFRDKDSFRYQRLMAFWHPQLDPQGVGYHPTQSLLAIGSLGLWGRGLGNGIQKLGYLPEDNTDFIFSIICEELGFPGALMVIALFFIFVLAGWRIASRCHNLFGKMVAFGITATIGLQAAMNIAVVTVSMPTKGIALPLISSGGTGWIMTGLAIGVLMSIERVTRLEAIAGVAPLGVPVSHGFPVIMAAAPGAASSNLQEHQDHQGKNQKPASNIGGLGDLGGSPGSPKGAP